MATVKVISGPQSTNAPAAATSDVHSNAVPSNVVILGTSGAAKPSPFGAASSFQLCNVPVHIGADGVSVSFLINQGTAQAMWVDGRGRPTP